jgi:hypothetical protein
MGIIFPDCIMDIIDIMNVMFLDSFWDITIIEVFIPDALAGIMTIMGIFIPVTFMDFMTIIIDIFIDAFVGTITIMGVIIMQVILAGHDSMVGFNIIPDSIMGIIILHPMLAGQDPIIPWPIAPNTGLTNEVASNAINATRHILTILFDKIIYNRRVIFCGLQYEFCGTDWDL